MDVENRSDKSFIKQKRILIAVIVALAAVIAMLLLKPQLPHPPRPPRPPEFLPPNQEKLKTLQGTVVAFNYNLHRDINAIVIKTESAGTITADFLPHTASAVMKVAGIGQAISFVYAMRPNNESVGYQLQEITNDKTKQTARLNELPQPPSVPDHAAENFNLQNPTLLTDNYGGIVALKKDSLLFHFKPGLVDDIMPLIKANHNFGLMAVKRDDDFGFINVDHDKVYIVISITIDNKTFLVR
jgi:hypothetical protein